MYCLLGSNHSYVGFHIVDGHLIMVVGVAVGVALREVLVISIYNPY